MILCLLMARENKSKNFKDLPGLKQKCDGQSDFTQGFPTPSLSRHFLRLTPSSGDECVRKDVVDKIIG